MKKIVKIIMGLSLILTISTGLYFKYHSTRNHLTTMHKSPNNNFMTIMYNHDKDSDYYKYDLETNQYKLVFTKPNNDYSGGAISRDGSILYYTSKDSNGKYNLYKRNINDNNSKDIQLTKDIKIDVLSLGDDKIFCRYRQNNRRECGIAIYNLLTNQLSIISTEQIDSDVYTFKYNHFTKKLYAIERSLKEMNNSHLPDIPVHRVVEYDENGNRLKQLFEINEFIQGISVSKDEHSALISSSKDTPLSKIYLLNFQNSSKEIILESTWDTMVSRPTFSPDEKGFYFVGIMPDSKILVDDGAHVEKNKGIYYYDFTTKKISKIFRKDDGLVNEYYLDH